MADDDAAADADLVRAILGSPDDDAPRLVYADLLQQRGDPRGELIALQCRPLAGEAHARREAELLSEHHARWLGAWHPHALDSRIERGFLTHLRIGASHAAALAPAIAAGAPEVAHLRSLELTWHDTERLADDHLEAIVAHPGLAALDRLDVSANGLRASSVELVARHLPRLAELRLSNQGIGNGAVTALAEAPRPLTRLHTLALTTQALSRAAGGALAEWPELAHVRDLDLSSVDIYDPWCNSLGAAGVEALARSPHCGALERLRIGDNSGLDDDALLGLCARLPRLTALDISFTGVADEGAWALSTSVFARTLTTLDIGHTGLTDDGLEHLLRLPALTSLILSDTAIHKRSLRALIAAPHAFTRLALRSSRDLPPALVEALRDRFGAALEL